MPRRLLPLMALVALGLYVGYLGLAFGLRSWLQRRRTGSTGWRGISGPPGSIEWLAGLLFAVALVLGFSAPMLDLFGVLAPIDALDGTVGHVIGVALSVTGIGLTLMAQLAMGPSWRIGVDPDEKTTLVTDGPFAYVRNPIFTAMIPTSLGLALLVPNVAAAVGFAGLLLALELQTRVVEEPYLLAAHGTSYRDYAARVGRFVPGVGRLRLP